MKFSDLTVCAGCGECRMWNVEACPSCGDKSSWRPEPFLSGESAFRKHALDGVAELIRALDQTSAMRARR